MRTYQIIVIMPTGARGHYTGIFEDGFAACIQCMEDFPEAKRISVRRLP